MIPICEIKKQIQVKEYYYHHCVKSTDRKLFLQLMKEWDGSKTVFQAFYDIDVLDMKNKEAREING